MKKILALLLALVMLFGVLAGCTAKSTDATDSSDQAAQDAQTPAESTDTADTANTNDAAETTDTAAKTIETLKVAFVPSREPQEIITAFAYLKEACAQENFEVAYHRGSGVLPSDADNIPGAVAACRNADAIVLVVGDVYAQYGETKDRADLALSGRQLELYRELRALGIPLVTVLLSSKPLAIPEIAHSTDALVCAFNGGMFGGQAVAEAIFGRLNPSGRLPISFPHHSGQVPVYYNHLPGWHWGHYSDLPAEPLFTFGEGIGYAPFVYRDLAVDADALTLSVKVRNAGDIAGEETVQVYLRDCVCEVMQPVKQLIAFRKVLLQPGEEQEVVFHLDRTAFTYINRAEERVFAPGDFMLMAGHSAKDEDLLKETVWVG